MKIVGLTGPIDHGKTTAAKFLMSYEPNSVLLESFHLVAEVADELKKKYNVIKQHTVVILDENQEATSTKLGISSLDEIQSSF